MEELEAGLLTECCDLLNTISTYPENKKCFDCCDNYSPRYLCTTFSTFVCSCCANIHQEFGHSIKVLSIFSFTLNEIYVLKETGNRVAADKWLARWRSDLFMEPDPTSATYKEDARKYMKAKYMEKRWVKLPPRLPGFRDESAEAEPRGYDDVSPRKDGVVQPTETSAVSQQHESKSVTQSVLRDTYTAPAPSIMYVPQPMYIPVSMPMPQMPQMTMAMPGVPQYAYTQYHMPQPDVNQQPSYYGAPLYNYQYESTHCLPPLPPPIMAEGVSWPGALVKPKKKRPITSTMHPVQRELTAPQSLSSSEELPPAPPGAILRSVSDNSIVTTYVLQIPKKEPVNTCDDCNTVGNTKISNNEPKPSDTKYKIEPNNKPDTKSNKSDSKIKLAGIMNKVVGFLNKKS